MIVFIASAVLKPRFESSNQLSKDPFLSSGVPVPQNLLEPLGRSKRSQEPGPGLSTTRIHRVLSLDIDTPFKTRQLRVHVPEAFHALPAISSRIRYHKSANSASNSPLVASLNMEIAPFTQDDVEITQVTMKLSDGLAQDLGQGLTPKLPLHCRPRDSIVFLYSLAPDIVSTDSTLANSRTLDVTINAIVLVSDECRPSIQMHWKTGVDFSSALNPTFRAPSRSMQRPHRSADLPISFSSSAVNIIDASAGDGHTQLDVPYTRQRAISIGGLGVTITFTTPKSVTVGEAFAWEVVILNNSSKPCRLAISAIPKRNSVDGKEYQARPTSSPANDLEIIKTLKAIVDEDALYTMQKAMISRPSGIISLSPTVEVG